MVLVSENDDPPLGPVDQRAESVEDGQAPVLYLLHHRLKHDYVAQRITRSSVARMIKKIHLVEDDVCVEDEVPPARGFVFQAPGGASTAVPGQIVAQVVLAYDLEHPPPPRPSEKRTGSEVCRHRL